nr:hypothetical protein [Angustibacter aerolatus]
MRYLGDFSDEGYSDVFVRAVDDVVAGVGVVRGDGLDDAGDGVETGDRDVRAAEADDHRAGEGREDAGRGQGLEGLDGSDGPAGDGAEPDADAAAPGGRRRCARPCCDSLLDALSLVLAALAPVLAATSLPRGWALVPAALALCWPLVTRPPWRAPSKTRHLGAYAPQRVLVAATAGLLAARDDAGAAAAVTALLLVVPGLEGWTRRVLDRPRLRVLHLPGLDYAPAASAVHRALYPAGLAVAALALVVAAVDGPVVVTVVATGLLVLLLLGLLVADVRLLRASDVAREQVLPALEAYQPEFVLYYAATAGAGYQVGMWMPYLERLGRRFVVVTRFARLDRPDRRASPTPRSCTARRCAASTTPWPPR